MKTGIFGGSFNPIHNGHIALAQRLLAEARLDEVWFVVSPHNPLKQAHHLLPDCLRLSMVQRALEPHPRLVACDAEFHLPQPSYTWITLQHLRQAHPHRQFVLLIGSDNWHCFDRWSHPHDILAHHPIVIYPRPGWPVCAHTLPQGVSLAHTPLMDISSTEVRRRLRVGESIAHLVPPVVEQMLSESNLTWYV